MKGYSKYVAQLEGLLGEALTKDRGTLDRELHAALNGQPQEQLRRLVSLAKQREAGAFFTGAALSAEAAKVVARTLDTNSVIFDPACGAGDLLIAASSSLRRSPTLSATLKSWNKQVWGRDLHPEFAATTRFRLALQALQIGAAPGRFHDDSIGTLSNIRKGCGLSDQTAIRKATHLLVNPPFTMRPAPAECAWARGTVNSAAVFIDEYARRARKGTRIVAILPDVLRSGSRYAPWRSQVESNAGLQSLSLWGQFSKSADVDVFLAEFRVGHKSRRSATWDAALPSRGDTLSDLFEIHVGPVVDYRSPHRGQWHPYLTTKELPVWTDVSTAPRKRRFSGTLFKPPFVVVRRTSRVGDEHRATATRVSGTSTFAVENHLIVLVPRDHRAQRCKDLIKLLRAPETTQWLDLRIRCRHLTTTALKDLPTRGRIQ